MHLRLIDYVLWFFASTIQLGVLVVMYRRGLQREYPYFFNYTVLQVIGDPILFVMQQVLHPVLLWLLVIGRTQRSGFVRCSI